MKREKSVPMFMFDEIMLGYICPGEEDPETGYEKGKEKGYVCDMDATIEIVDMDKFITITDHDAGLVGTVSVPGLGSKLKIDKGVFTLFEIQKDPDTYRTQKTMVYMIHFKSEIGEPYYLRGVKKLFYHTGRFDPIHQMTTLYTKIYKGDREDKEKLFAAGILNFKILDVLSLVNSMRVTNTDSLEKKIRITSQFLDFVYEEALEIYFNRIGLCYRTDGLNFVLSGKCSVNGRERHFYFCSGAHDQGFPWDDNQSFWDVSLILSTLDGQNPDRYIIGKTELENILKLEIVDSEQGQEKISHYSYKGKLYRLKEGYQVSFSDDLADPSKSRILEEVDADIEIDFVANVPKEGNVDVPGVILPFGLPEGLKNPVLLYFHKLIKKYAASTHGLGIRLGIRSVSVKNARIKVAGKDVELKRTEVWGEAEKLSFNFVREPALKYHYFCGIDPENKKVNVYAKGGVLYNHTSRYMRTMFDHIVSALAHPFSTVEVRMKDSDITKIEHCPKPVTIKDNYILEVNYDHFDTAVFQRRVVLLTDAGARTIWALEEDMKRINCRRIPPAVEPETVKSPLNYKRATVAVYKSRRAWPLKEENPLRDRPGLWDNFESLFNLNKQHIPGAVPEKQRIQLEDNDKKELLRKVVQKTKFIHALENRAKALKKAPADLKILLKPNFMFTYNKRDHTTYTDPVLVKELIDIMYYEGFTNISVVESQSTYGQYFENRNVKYVANYIGLDGGGGKYRIVDLTEDEQIEPEIEFAGRLKGQKVPETWAHGDFRISFAKNKTHSYAYYTLAIKCIYGALPLADKFKEYHCKMGIYGSTIEYLLHYPVDFGFIDAYVSADGPFGIFADKSPNYTRTIIGGENIIAVSWVGASKMGYDPMVSQFMKNSVTQFGKPRIDLAGDLKDEVYSPWANVPIVMEIGLNDVLDRHYRFGNLMYSALSNMDEKAFPRKPESIWMKAVRFMDKPIRDMVFVQKTSPELAKLMYHKGSFQEPDKNAFNDVIFDK
jgi:uncharacterized protein (DUF362 family)